MDENFITIDTSWITTILGISFSLVIFLLGFPIFFWQTYVPESLRKYHGKIQNHQKRLIKKSILLLLPIILLLGVHIFQFPIKIYVCSYLRWEICTSIFGQEILILLYVIITLSYFLFFVYKVLTYFRKSVIKKEDAKTVILNTIFKEIKTKSKINEDTISISEEKICCQDVLMEFAAIYHSPYDRNSFLKKIFELIEHKIENNYNGFEIKPIYDPILENIFIKDSHHCTISNVNELINTTNKIAAKYKNSNLNSLDQQFITKEFLIDLCFLLVENYDYNTAQKCISSLKEFNCSQDVLFKIFYFAFTKRDYLYLTKEIGLLSKKIMSKSFGDKENTSSVKYNLIAYLSMFYNEHDMTKKYALQTLKELKDREFELNKLDFEEAKLHFYEDFKFDTANNIHLMIKGYFRKPTKKEL